MSRGSKAIKRLRTAVVAVAITGLFLASLGANLREPPLVRIGEIKPIMNFSTVRVQGVLESDVRQLRGGSVLYMVNDGTGKLPVFLVQAPDGKLPTAGSRITVEGYLGIGTGNELRMRVQSADRIAVAAEAFISDLKLSDITAEQDGARMTVYGRVSMVWNPRPGSKAPHKIVLADPSGSLEVIHWFEPDLQVEVGDELEIFGTVDLYKGRVQLKVWDADDIRPLSG